MATKREKDMRVVLVLLVILLAAFLVFFFLFSGCERPLKGSDQVKTEDFGFTDFNRIEVNGPFNVAISYAANYTVNITANANLFERIKYSNEDSLLKIDIQSSSYWGKQRTQFVDTTMNVTITLPHLRGITLTGKAKGTLTGFDSRAGIDFSISGTSTLDIPELIAGDLNFTVSGQSNVTGNITAG
jgi:hypothetical protein